MNNWWKDLPRPILCLAPMSGYTESPFRRLVREIEPSTVLISELISAEAMRRGNEKTMRLTSFHADESKYYCVQLFGKTVEAFIEAGKMVEDMGADGIDLNLGCPSPKVVGSGHGSALLKDPCASAKMMEALVKAVNIPVSVKMRLGFYDDTNILSTVKTFESAGIASVAIHGRTTKQAYRGQANWEPIYRVKEESNIPVLGNGDVTSATIAVKKLQNLDGMMIGRASLRNPWIFRQCRAAFDGQEIPKKPPLEEQLEFFRKHAKLGIAFKGEQWAMIELRKHFAHFVRGVRHASKFREQLIRVESYAQLERIFDDILAVSRGEKEYVSPLVVEK